MQTGNMIFDNFSNSTDVIAVLPEELMKQISTFMTILQALGGVIIIYLVFNIINTVLNKRKKRELQTINQNLADVKELLEKQCKYLEKQNKKMKEKK